MIEELNEPQGRYASQNQKDTEGGQMKKRVSLEEYLEMIADGERRLEYHDGQVIDIQSATEQHGLICTNLTGLLYICNRNKKCKAYAGDREVWIEKCRKMFYPDLIIVCGEHDMKQMSKNVKATINPTVVIEVLSDSTERFDLTTKMKCYKSIKSLKQIIFVAQTEKYILSIDRSDENDLIWIDNEYIEAEEIVPIGDCPIQLKEIYDQVDFEIKADRV